MATAEWAHSQSHSNDAGFRLWGSTLSTKLQSLPGLVKTADTGQVDWLTVSKPGSGSYVNEFYYLNDSLHATYPIYFQIKYGSSAYSATAPMVQVMVGTGTTGSGVLTGASSASAFMVQANAGTSIPLLNFISAGEGYLTMLIAVGIPNGAGAPALTMINFSRFCDEAGDIVSGGGILYSPTSGNGTTRQVLRGSTWYDEQEIWGINLSTGYTSTIYNNLPQVMPDFILQTPKFRFNPNVLFYLSNEYANYVVFQATPIGTSQRQYLTFGAKVTNNATFRQAYRYE